MISAEQIRRIAREEKLAVGVVEKDYVLTWLLKAVMMPFSISKSTRLESILSKRSISSVASLSSLAFFIFPTFR